MQNYRLDVEGIYLTPYVNLGLLTVFLYAAFTHYTEALATAAHERLRTAEREQTLLHERQRLMREMHAGVGS